MYRRKEVGVERDDVEQGKEFVRVDGA